MKPILYFILFSFLCISCIDDNVQEPQTRLKRKIKIESLVFAQKIVWEYFYDSSGKLQKITRGSLVEEKYIYDNDYQLINKKIYNYANDELGWVIIDSTVYGYVDGKLNEELKYGTFHELFQRTEYEYVNSKLIKKIAYWDENNFMITILEYSDGLCTKETRNNGTNGTGFIAHYYFDGKLSFSENYNIGFDGNILLQQINYTYNERGDLVLEKSIQKASDIVANLNYTYMYEYEEFYK